MAGFVSLLVDFYSSIFNLLSSCYIGWNNLSVPLSSIFFALIVTGFVISVFWKGAKT